MTVVKFCKCLRQQNAISFDLLEIVASFKTNLITNEVKIM